MPYAFQFLLPWPQNLIKNLAKCIHKIVKYKFTIRPTKDDVLFVFTEEELLNLIFIKRFSKRGAKIYLIEDGAAAYHYYSVPSDPISKKATIIKYLFRFLFGLKGYYPFNINGYLVPRISDKYYSGICYFFPIKILREIPVVHINKNVDIVARIKSQNAVFLTQPIYRIYLSFQDYTQNLKMIVENLIVKFDILYIKFHPDELNTGDYLKIKSCLPNHKNLVYIEGEDSIEQLVHKFKFDHVISYNSSALMNLLFYGVEPIYLYHLFPFLEDSSTIQFTSYLNTLGYNFPKSLSAIDSNFQSGLQGNLKKGININLIV